MPPLSTQLSPLLTADLIEKLARQGIKTGKRSSQTLLARLACKRRYGWGSTAHAHVPVTGYVHSELVPLSQATGIPYKLLTSIQQSLLAQFAAPPTTAADLWHELGEISALLPTGTRHTHTHMHTHTPNIANSLIPLILHLLFHSSHLYCLSQGCSKLGYLTLYFWLILAIPPFTGSIDKLLVGGLMTGELTELTGVSSSGKTQV